MFTFFERVFCVTQDIGCIEPGLAHHTGLLYGKKECIELPGCCVLDVRQALANHQLSVYYSLHVRLLCYIFHYYRGSIRTKYCIAHCIIYLLADYLIVLKQKSNKQEAHLNLISKLSRLYQCPKSFILGFFNKLFEISQ